MADEPLALTVQASPPSEADYHAIHNAVMETARGRWFLLQYARRNRNADTEMLLRAISRLEALIRSKADAPLAGEPAAEFGGLAKAIAQTRARLGEIGASVAAVAKVNPASDYDGPLAALAAATAAINGAVEHLQETAWFMHEHKLDPALCANLEATTREIAEACALLDRADEGMRAAIALMRDLEGRVGASAESSGENHAPQAAAATDQAPVAAATVEDNSPLDDGIEEILFEPMPEPVRPRVESAASRPSPPAELPPQAPAPLPQSAPLAATAEKPALQPPSGGRGGWLSRLLADESGSIPALHAPAAPRAAPPDQPAKAAASDPLAPVMALSDEERIALFS